MKGLKKTKKILSEISKLLDIIGEVLIKIISLVGLVEILIKVIKG